MDRNIIHILDFVIYNTWIELGEQVVLSVQLLEEMGLTFIYLPIFFLQKVYKVHILVNG